MNKKSRQVPFFLYWPVENVQFCINFIVHFGWLSGISNFRRFQKNVSSLELLQYISENSSPKGYFWRNKRKSEFSELSLDSPMALNKLECGDVDHSIDFAGYRVEWLCSLLVRLGGSLEENLLPRLQEAQQFLAILDRDDYFNCTSYAPPVIKTGIRGRPKFNNIFKRY